MVKANAGPDSLAQQMDNAERQRLALEAHRDGHDWTTVAQMAGYSSRGAAYNAVRHALRRSLAETNFRAEEYRELGVERLTTLLGACWPKAMGGSERHIDQARKIISDISDLVGAKAPVQMEIVEGNIDGLLSQLDEELARRAAAIPGEVVAGAIEA